jgi:hypothetical protein
MAPFALALAASVLAAPADAGGRKWGHHKRHHHHHRHHHGCGHGGYYAPRYVEYRAYPVYHYAPAAPAYYCGPCGHHFDSYDHLSYHVHRHHHVAVLELPSVIFQASIGGGVGWVFGH